MKNVNVSATLLKITLGVVVLLVLGALAFLSREVQPEIRKVTKTVDISNFDDNAE